MTFPPPLREFNAWAMNDEDEIAGIRMVGTWMVSMETASAIRRCYRCCGIAAIPGAVFDILRRLMALPKRRTVIQ